MKLESMSFRYDGEKICVLDQTRLPQEKVWLDVTEPDLMIEAIRSLRVRGAPLIGLAAAVTLAHAAKQLNEDQVRALAGRLREARPTAVNLMNALNRLTSFAPGEMTAERLMSETRALFAEDQMLCERISVNGADWVLKTLARDPAGEPSLNILTHCNTGGLATAGVGTAIGIIRELHKRTQGIHVYVDETRPLLQGGRLTAWEMNELSIPHTLICDNMAALLMRDGQVDCVMVGCDRIARNGDFANKVGTYSLAILARHHGVPFLVAGPNTTVDLKCASGREIPIEQRPTAEVHGVKGAFGDVRWAPSTAPVFNPAFDVTPAELVTAWVLDNGVFTSPSELIRAIEGE